MTMVRTNEQRTQARLPVSEHVFTSRWGVLWRLLNPAVPPGARLPQGGWHPGSGSRREGLRRSQLPHPSQCKQAKPGRQPKQDNILCNKTCARNMRSGAHRPHLLLLTPCPPRRGTRSSGAHGHQADGRPTRMHAGRRSSGPRPGSGSNTQGL